MVESPQQHVTLKLNSEYITVLFWVDGENEVDIVGYVSRLDLTKLMQMGGIRHLNDVSTDDEYDYSDYDYDTEYSEYDDDYEECTRGGNTMCRICEDNRNRARLLEDQQSDFVEETEASGEDDESDSLSDASSVKDMPRNAVTFERPVMSRLYDDF